MIVEILLFISFLVWLLPGVYLASQKNYILFLNKNMNTFLARFFFLAPGAAAFNIMFLSFGTIIFLAFSNSAERDSITTCFVVLVFSIIGSLLTIFYFKRYALKKDMPPEYQENFMGSKFYVFMPTGKHINDRASYEISKKTGFNNIRIQISDLSINSKKYDKDILFTKYGALLVSLKALKIFEENELTGYKTRNIVDEKTRAFSSFYFQIVSISEMPKMLSQTKLKNGFFIESLAMGSLINDDIIYYKESDLGCALDFNKTLEYLGTNQGFPYYHQKFWIVSHKAMDVLINQLGQQKRDFIPVYLSGNEKK